MKKRFLPLFIAIALLIPSTVVMTGCAGGHGTYTPSTGVYDINAPADTAIVTAQKTRSIALGVFDLFLQAERQNEAQLKALNPAFHATAEEIRKNGKIWIGDLTRLIANYQGNRTTSNEINLRQALGVIQSAIASAQDALAQTASLPKPQ